MSDQSVQTLKALGINVNLAGKHKPNVLSGKRCYGRLLEDATPGFDYLDHMAQNAPIVKAVQCDATGAKDPDTGAPLTFETGQQHMVIDGKVKGTFSGRFNPYQHDLGISDLRHALSDLGITRLASTVRFDNEGARMAAHVMLPNLQEGAGINLLDDTGEDILMGVRLRNGHDGSNALGVSLIGVRTICTNFNNWGEDRWGVSISHTNGRMVEEFKRALGRLQTDLKTLPDVINAAKDMVVSIKELAPIFIGAGMPAPYVIGGKRGHSKTVPPLAANPWAYNPAIKEGAASVSLWDAYNAGTALATHVYDAQPSAVESVSGNLSRMLLIKSLPTLLARGNEALDVIAEKEKVE